MQHIPTNDTATNIQMLT